jgi:hypothetical protein
MEYKGTWNASTNTPTLANGTGDTGDVYICNVAGTVNFGAGAIAFAVGDYVIYSGTIWQRSSGAVGTVTSVAVSRSGDALAITGSPVTTSGTINIGFAGNSTQYINGAGNLVTFPGVINEAQNLITEVYNKTGATLTKGTVVYIDGGQGNLPTITKALATGDSTSAQTYGIVRNDITNNNNGYVVVAGRISDLDTQAYTEGTQLYLSPTTAGTFTSTKPYAPQHLVYVGIVVRAHPTQGVVEVKIQNGYELDELHNVAAQTPSNNDGLFWEASTSLWKNKSISTIIGGSPVYGSGTTNYITKWSATSGELINSSLVDIGGTIYNALTNAGQFAWQFNGDTTTGQSYGALINAGTNASDIALRIQNASSTSVYFYVWGDGKVQINNIPNATTDTDKFLVSDSGVIKYRTGAELLSDIGGASASGYVPYTGATANLNLGTNDLLSRSVYIEGATSFQAGLLMKQYSVYNFVTGAYTQIAPSTATELNIVHNQANTTRRRYALSVAALQDGDSFQYLVPRKDGTFAMTSDIPSLTGYVQGSGTTNYLPKFTGASTIGNSQIFDNGTSVGIGTASPNGKLTLSYSSSLVDGLIFINTASGGRQWRIGDGSGASAGSFGFYDATAAATRLTLDASGNLGLGVTPSAWGSALRVIQGPNSDFVFTGRYPYILSNGFFDTSWKYVNSEGASFYVQAAGQHQWFNAPSGTAGNAISFTQAMTLNASGNLSLGNTNDTYKLDVTGTGRFSGNSTLLTLRSDAGTKAVFETTRTFGVNRNFQIAVDEYAEGQFTITPSTTQGGSGYTTPIFKLAASGAATFSSSVTATTGLTVGSLGSGSDAIITLATNASGSPRTIYYKASTATINFTGTGGTDLMTLTNGGNLGIGTTSPSARLNIAGGDFRLNGVNANSRFIVYENYSNSAVGVSLFNNSGTEVISLNGNAGNINCTGSITTGAPTNGTAQPWKLGDARSGGISTDSYIIVSVNGVTYSIPALNGLP